MPVRKVRKNLTAQVERAKAASVWGKKKGLLPETKGKIKEVGEAQKQGR